jgi:hypothetical protein
MRFDAPIREWQGSKNVKSYIISFDLRKNGSNNSRNVERISAALHCAGETLAIGTATFILKTSFTSADEVFNAVFKTCVDGNDRIFISQLCRDKQGWLSKEAWEWLGSCPKCCHNSDVSARSGKD